MHWLVALASACLVLTASGCRCESTPSAPAASVSPSAATTPRKDGPLAQKVRARAQRDGDDLVKHFDALAKASRERHKQRAWQEYLELRRAYRRLAPVEHLLGYAAAALEPPRDELDEVDTDVGLRALGDRLLAPAPNFPELERVIEKTRPAARLPSASIATLPLRPTHLGVALSTAIFDWGLRLDGSQAESPDEVRVDVLDGGRGLVAHVRLLEAVVPEDRRGALTKARQGFERWLDAQPAQGRPRDLLRGLLLSGALGGEVRRAFAVLGTDVKPPFVPRELREKAVAFEAVSVASFPRLPGPAPDPERVALGRQLFSDPRLSKNGKLSCASCHVPRFALGPGPRRPSDVDGKPLARDVPSLWNTAYDAMHFWDGRASTLPDQVRIAVERDMGGDWQEIERRVSADPTLQREFRRVVRKRPSADVLREMIEEFERTLVSAETPFDRFVRGDESALNADELAGFDLYFGPARCSRCHRLPLTSGVQPPRFTRAEVTAIGVPTAPTKAELDPDRGRGALTGRPHEQFAFKVPTLRNLAATAPYFHNGAFATLEQVVRFYRDGSGQGLGIAPPSFDPDAAKLDLTPHEERQLVAFLQGGLRDPRTTLPAATGEAQP